MVITRDEDLLARREAGKSYAMPIAPQYESALQREQGPTGIRTIRVNARRKVDRHVIMNHTALSPLAHFSLLLAIGALGLLFRLIMCSPIDFGSAFKNVKKELAEIIWPHVLFFKLLGGLVILFNILTWICKLLRTWFEWPLLASIEAFGEGGWLYFGLVLLGMLALKTKIMLKVRKLKICLKQALEVSMYTVAT